MRRFFFLLLLSIPVFASGQEEMMCRPSRNSFKSADDTPKHYISTGGQDSLIQACLADFKADSLKKFVQQLEAFQTRFCFANNNREVAVWLRNQYLAYGCDEAALDSLYLVDTYMGDTLEGWMYNVIGTLYGNGSPDLEYLMGGHYDAVVWQNGNSFVYAPGADDNGSAIAACLETLRVFKKHGFRPRSTIRIIGFAAEELGLHGSRNYAQKAAAAGTPVMMYFNMDMIGNESKTSEWKVIIFKYEYGEYGAEISRYICENHTLLTPLVVEYNAGGSDSYAFWEQKLPATYFEEDEFSPNWHFPSDVDSNMNFPYLRETAAAACGSLIWSAISPAPLSLKVVNPGDGQTLIPCWNPAPEQDLDHYIVHLGYEPGTYFTSYSTTDTLLELNGLLVDTLYYIGVAGVNTGGYEGMITEDSDRPAHVTLDPGVLIVQDSDGADPYVPDSVVKQFYDSLCLHYNHAWYSAYHEDQIRLADLGKWKGILWNINKSINNTVLYRYQREVKNYLDLGGKIFFTVYTPSKALMNNTKYPANYGPGDFIFDYAFVDTVVHTHGSAFNAAYAVAQGYPDLHVDSSKVTESTYYHLIRIEGLIPGEEANIIYRYNTNFDTTTNAGKMKHQPVGIEHPGPDRQVILLSVPLYYIEKEQSQALIDFILKEKFDIYPAYISQEEPTPGLSVSPNPARDFCTVNVTLNTSEPVSFKLVNALGQIVHESLLNDIKPGSHSFTINVTSYPPGIYNCLLQTSGRMVMEKMIVVR